MVEEFCGISLKNRIVMGILNLSSKTFYKGSLVCKPKDAANRAEKMVKEGAQIIDLGAMSTGPNVEPISLEEELDLLLPALEKVRTKVEVPISIDTQRAIVAEEALEMGADIINDESGLKADTKTAKIIGEYNCSAILMANKIKGRIRTAEKNAKDIESIDEIKEALKDSLQICKKHKIKPDKVAIDPGIGFGKGADWDLKVIANLEELSELGRPICIGVSRKSFIGKVLRLEDPYDRLVGSLGATAVGVMNGANIIRTHDPKETTQMVRMMEAIIGGGENQEYNPSIEISDPIIENNSTSPVEKEKLLLKFLESGASEKNSAIKLSDLDPQEQKIAKKLEKNGYIKNIGEKRAYLSKIGINVAQGAKKIHKKHQK